MTEPIRVTMQVARVQTLADGGTRWTFDLSEGHALETATLIVCKEQEALIEAVMTPKFREDDLTKLDNETEKKAERAATKLGR